MCTIGGSSKVYSNFDFLKEKFPVLANFGELAEKYLYSDSNSCLLKLGMIGETIVNLIFIYDRIDLPVDNTSANRIHTLYREGVVTSDLADILHGLRKIRNKAVHENYASVEDGKIFIQMAYSLTEWFMQTYGDWNYQNKPFEMPDKNVRLEIVDKEKEQTEEEKLIAEASKVAAMALSVKKEERKSQAGKAMRQRVKSEAETRYLIDEQLRKVGWEVDTQKLRYSKGTRPEKGRNIAIAEWPTDSTVGKKGFADYALFIDERLVAIIEAKPVVVNPTATFTQLLEGLEVLTDEKEVQNQINQIIAKLQRKKQNMSSKAMEHFISLSGGYKPTQFIANIQSYDSPSEAKKQLLACGELFKMLDQLKPNGGRSVVISKHEDELLEHTRGYGNGSKPEDYLDAFAMYVKTKMDEIAALNIVCTRPKELTRDSLKSLRLTLDREGFTTQQLNTAISQMTNQEITADIISLIRRYAIGSALISHEARIKRAIDKLKKAHNFSKQELNWIARMEKYLMEESVLNVTVFDEDGRFKSQGGFNKINKVFGNKLENIVFELNEYLYDDGGRTA